MTLRGKFTHIHSIFGRRETRDSLKNVAIMLNARMWRVCNLKSRRIAAAVAN